MMIKTQFMTGRISAVFFSRCAIVFIAALLLTGQAYAADAVGRITHLSGVLSVKRADGAVKILSVQSDVMEGDLLTTEKDAYARIKFIDEAEMVLRPNSVLRVANYKYKQSDPQSDSIVFDMLKGGLRAITGLLGKRNKERFSLNTPTATIGIRGTHLGALFCQNDCGGVPTPTGKTPDNGLHVDVASGAIVVTPKLTVALPSGAKASLNLPPAAGTPPAATSGVPGNSQQPGTSSPGPTTPGTPAPTPGVPAPAGNSAPSVVLNAGQFGYLPPPQNGVQPPLVLVPPSQAVQVRMPQSISQNNPQGSATSKGTDPECVVQ